MVESSETVFSLGDSLTCLCLIIAIYELRQKTSDVILKIRTSWLKTAIVFSAALGVLFTCFSKIDNYAYFSWVGFILLMISAIILFIGNRCTKWLFNPRRAKVFYFVLLNQVVSNRDDCLEIVVDIIKSNIREIVTALKVNKITKDNGQVPEVAAYADAIIYVILNDEKIAKYIVTQRLDFLIKLLSLFKYNNLGFDQTLVGLNQIFEQLLYNEDSFLYKQLDYRGFALAVNLYSVIFSEPYFVENLNAFAFVKYNPLKRHSEEEQKVFLRALESALHGYWRNASPIKMGRVICHLFDCINADIYRTVKVASESTDYNDYAWKRLSNFGHFLSSIYITIYRDSTKDVNVAEHEKNLVNNEMHGVKSVHLAFGACVVSFIEQLAKMQKGREEACRLLMVAIWTNLNRSGRSDIISKIRDNVSEMLWEKIELQKNGNEQPLLKLMLNYFGAKVDGSAEFSDMQREKLIAFLEQFIKPRINCATLSKANRKRIKVGVLPKSVIFNRQRGIFLYSVCNGETTQDMVISTR